MRAVLLSLLSWLMLAASLPAADCLLLDLSRPQSHRFSVEDRAQIQRMIGAQFKRDFPDLQLADESSLVNHGIAEGENCYSCDASRQLELARELDANQLISFRLYYESEYHLQLLLLHSATGVLLNRRDSANENLDRLIVNVPYELQHLCSGVVGIPDPEPLLPAREVRLNSRPQGAEVRKDGLLLGTTPLALRIQPAVAHLELRLAGKAALGENLILGIDSLVIRDLDPAGGTITVHSNPQGHPLYIDGKLMGRTPGWDLSVSPGQHLLRVGNPDTHEQVIQRIQVKQGEDKEYKILLTPIEGTLTVAAVAKGGEVVPVEGFLDGSSLGILPWQGSVPVGLHRVKVGAEERVIRVYDSHSEVVEFRVEGVNDWGEVLLATGGWLIVSSTPPSQPVFVDDELLGTTDLFTPVSSGRELLVRVGDGRNAVPQTQRVRLQTGQHQRLEFVLQPLLGFLELSCVDRQGEPVLLPLLVDGQHEFELPFSDSLLAGEHSLQVDRWRRKVELGVAEHHQLKWELDTLVIPDGRRIPVLPGPLPGMAFVEIPAGRFTMGSTAAVANADESPLRQVEVGAFQLMNTELTQAQWCEVMHENPAAFKGDSLPVEQVTREQILRFIKLLNKRDREWKYRLPSEAEWEYAARSGREEAYVFCDTPDQLAEHAWYEGNSHSSSSPVARLKPNPWGLYDMLGNVWELCADKYFDRYPQRDGDARPRKGVSNHYVRRGGSWANDAGNCRVSNRSTQVNSRTSERMGFRLAREKR